LGGKKTGNRELLWVGCTTRKEGVEGKEFNRGREGGKGAASAGEHILTFFKKSEIEEN